MTHTPGPWQADLIAIEDEDGVRCVQVYGPEGQGHGRVAQVYAECGQSEEPWQKEELWHNVHLVEAAPNLLEACETAYNELVSVDRETGIVAQEVFGELSAAIAKAKGDA